MTTLEGLVRVERAERFEIEGPGTVRTPAELPATVTIVNLSRSGCLYRTIHHPEVGSTLSLGIPGLGARPATVVRTAPEGVGCAFLTLLTEEELRHALATTQAQAGDTAAIIRQLRQSSLEAMDSTPRRGAQAWLQRLRASRRNF